jgi:hypothetical protein
MKTFNFLCLVVCLVVKMMKRMKMMDVTAMLMTGKGGGDG